jgi:preprotein translocase subunit SecF
MRLLKLIPDNTNIGFVRIRHIAFIVTALLTVAALALLFTRGLNLGVDFKGGVAIQEQFQTPPKLDEVRATVSQLDLGEPTLQQTNDTSKVTIRVPIDRDAPPEVADRAVEKVQAAITAKFPGSRFTDRNTVSGKVSDELIQKGALAVFLAIIGIAVFSWFRYEWQFGISTAVAILHDVLMTLGFFAAFREWLTFDLNIVAAVLTIIGYSINDKMVIDDRIRENMRKYRKMGMGELIDLSVNETLPRTVMTSLTVLIALASLAIFGGEVLRGFTLAMILGVIVGTYSSIYVSSSLLITLGMKPGPIGTKGQPDPAISGTEKVRPQDLP